MTLHQPAENGAMFKKLPRGEVENGEEEVDPPQTSSPSLNPDESSTPFTSFVTSTISHSHQSDDPTSTPDSTQSDSPSATPTFTPSIKSSILPSQAPSSSHIWHPTRVGTVVAESEIPDAWAPKKLDKEKQMGELFIGCMSLVFVLTLAGIIGVGCWESFWDPDFAPQKISGRRKRAAKKQQRERERIRALEDAMELQKELQREEEEMRLMEMEMEAKDSWEKREKDREMIRQVEVETETEMGMETESEGRLSEGVQSEQSMERLLKYA